MVIAASRGLRDVRGIDAGEGQGVGVDAEDRVAEGVGIGAGRGERPPRGVLREGERTGSGLTRIVHATAVPEWALHRPFPEAGNAVSRSARHHAAANRHG